MPRHRLNIKVEKDLYLLLGNYGFVRGDDEAFLIMLLFPCAYNRKIGPVLRWEAFTQLQFNKISLI
jgi:hypothetical protein